MRKKLTRKESFVLGFLYRYMKSKPKQLHRSLFYKVSDLIDARSDKVRKAHLNKPISKARLAGMFRNRGPWFRIGYVEKTPNKIITGIVLASDKRFRLSNMQKVEVLPSKNDDRNIVLFKIVNSEISIVGNKDRLIKRINNNFKFKYATEDRELLDIEPDKKLKELIEIPKKDDQIHIYTVQYNDVEDGKKLRVRAYSDSGTVLDRFLKQNFKSSTSEQNLTLIITLSFSDGKEKALLKVTRINENQYLLKWKGGENELSRKISKLLGINGHMDALLMDSKDDKKILNDLFREERVDPYSKKNIYSRILKDYADYLDLTWYDKPVLKYENIRNTIRDGALKLGFKVSDVQLVKKNGLYFPSKRGEAKQYHVLRFIKDGKIIQYVLLDQEKLYEIGNEQTIKKFFMLSPFIILDFRRNLKPDFDYYKFNNYILNSGDFLFNLKNDTNALIKMLTETGKDVIEKLDLTDHYKVTSELLGKIETMNLNSQQKGALFETICFIILSKVFLTKKIGGSRQPDGKFIIDDTKIVYDAKNLGPKTSLIKSVTKDKHIKDIDYIKQENATHYVYITRQIEDEMFNKVKQKIESAVPTCTVSAITAKALQDLVKLYSDPRLVSKKKIKDLLCSGKLVKQIHKDDISVSL